MKAPDDVVMPRGRPRGEERQALAKAVRDLVQEVGPVTFVQAAERAQVGYAVARVTMRDMASAGELVRCGKDKPAGSRHWLTLFEPAEIGDTLRPWGGIEDLARVFAGWNTKQGSTS
jgi:hypothetical protein